MAASHRIIASHRTAGNAATAAGPAEKPSGTGIASPGPGLQISADQRLAGRRRSETRGLDATNPGNGLQLGAEPGFNRVSGESRRTVWRSLRMLLSLGTRRRGGGSEGSPCLPVKLVLAEEAARSPCECESDGEECECECVCMCEGV